MFSMAHNLLPDFDSPTLALKVATDEERLQAWNVFGSEWEGPFSLEAFVDRLKYLSNQEATRDGGIKTWILYDTAETLENDKQHTILARCETLRRNAIISHHIDGAWKVEEVVCYGIASVYCRKEFRMKGYARRMVTELSSILSGMNPLPGFDRCTFSVLYSNVGTVMSCP